MSYTDEDRPDCKGCGARKAALNKGELAYKGFCSRCYKADVEERRGKKAAKYPAECRDVTPPPAPADLLSRLQESVKPAQLAESNGGRDPDTAEFDYAGAEDDEPEPRHPHVCGWCVTGNHVERPEDEPDFEDEMGITRRGRPRTRGCAAEQLYIAGPLVGEPKGLQCACHDAGHDRSKLAAK